MWKQEKRCENVSLLNSARVLLLTSLHFYFSISLSPTRSQTQTQGLLPHCNPAYTHPCPDTTFPLFHIFIPCSTSLFSLIYRPRTHTNHWFTLLRDALRPRKKQTHHSICFLSSSLCNNLFSFFFFLFGNCIISLAANATSVVLGDFFPLLSHIHICLKLHICFRRKVILFLNKAHLSPQKMGQGVSPLCISHRKL